MPAVPEGELHACLVFANRNGLHRLARGRGGLGVTQWDTVDEVLATDDFTKNGVLTVQERGRGGGDEELRTVAVHVVAGSGHSQVPRFVERDSGGEFTFDGVARTTHAGAGWVAALGHEVLQDAMEGHAIIEAIFGQKNEGIDCLGSQIWTQLDDDVAARSFDGGGVVFGGVDGHRRSRCILFAGGGWLCGWLCGRLCSWCRSVFGGHWLRRYLHRDSAVVSGLWGVPEVEGHEDQYGDDEDCGNDRRGVALAYR